LRIENPVGFTTTSWFFNHEVAEVTQSKKKLRVLCGLKNHVTQSKKTFVSSRPFLIFHLLFFTKTAKTGIKGGEESVWRRVKIKLR
jgi:hypothetical protein